MNQQTDYLAFRQEQGIARTSLSPVTSGQPQEQPTPQSITDQYSAWRTQQQATAGERATLAMEMADPTADVRGALERQRRANELGIGAPADLLVDSQSELSRQIERQTMRQQLTGSSSLSGWIVADPLNASLARANSDELSATAGLFNSVARGVDRFATGWYYGRQERRRGEELQDLQHVIEDRERSFSSIMDDIQNDMTLDDFDANIGLTVARTYGQALARFTRSRVTFASDEQLERYETTMTDAFSQAIENRLQNAGRINDTYGSSSRVAAISTAVTDVSDLDTFSEQISGLGSIISNDPVAFAEWLANVTLESTPSLVTGAITTRLTGSTTMGATAMGATSAQIGMDAAYDQIIRDAGYDLTNPEHRLAFINDPQVRMRMSDRAFAYGATVGIMDGISGGLASRTMANTAGGDLLLQSLTQAAMGSSGEALALMASDQQLNMVDIIIEGMAETITAPLEIAGVGARSLGQRRQVQDTQAFMDALDEQAGNSEVRRTAPDRYRDLIADQVRDTAVENVYIDAQGLNQLFQSRPELGDAETFVRQLTGADVEAFRDAVETGGQFELPMATYATDLAGTDIGTLLREHLRVDPEHMSLAEAREFETQAQDLLNRAEGTVREIDSGQRELERAAEEARVELTSQLRQAGRVAAVAEREALQAVAFARTTAERMGIPLQDFLSRYPLAQVQSALQTDNVTVTVDREPIRAAAEQLTSAEAAYAAMTPDTPTNERRAADQARTEAAAALKEAFPAIPEPAEMQRLQTANPALFDAYVAVADQPGTIGNAVMRGDSNVEELLAGADAALAAFEAAQGTTLQQSPVPTDGVDVSVTEDATRITVNKLVADEPGTAAGTRYMESLTAYADRVGKQIALTPSKAFGGSVPRLKQFYARFGFVPNRGKNKDFETRETMLREPQPGALYQSENAPRNTQTEAFKKWFGDSKVVDENGEPLVVYHGTDRDFEQFDTGEAVTRSGLSAATSAGFFFSSRPASANVYAGRDEGAQVVPVYLSVKNPMIIDGPVGDQQFSPEAIIDAANAAVVAQAKAAGHDGVIVRRKAGDEYDGALIVALEPTQIKSVNNQGTFDPSDPRILYQGENAPRGSILLPTAEGQAPLVTLFEGADLSTFLHESGHYFLHVIEDIARRGEGSEGMQQDWQTIRDWWASNTDAISAEAKTSQKRVKTYLADGTTGDAKVDRKIAVALQEQWARAYEKYLLEGKAPSLSLRSAFEAFSAWLSMVYKRVKGDLNVNVSPELTGVFDRLLATDDEIAKAAEDMNVVDIVGTAESLGIEPEEYQRLVRLSTEARDEARQNMLAEIMEPIRLGQTEEAKRKRAVIEEQVREKVNRKPVNRAREWLANGRWLGDDAPDIPDDLRLNYGMLVEEHGQEIADALPRGKRAMTIKSGGLSADDVAGWFGYATGSEMLNDLIASPTPAAETRALTEAQMRKEVADPITDGEIADAAIRAMHGDKRGQFIAAELRAINKTARGKATTRNQAREIARRTLRSMPIRQAVRSGQYLAAERRAAERSAQALAKGDHTAAFNAKREQLLNHALYMESRAAAEILAKTERKVARLKKKGTRKNLAGEYLAAIDDVLASYDFRKSTTQRQESKRRGLIEYVEMMTEAGRENELAIPADVLDEAQRKPYRQLTAAQLEGVYDTLSNIEHTARMKQKLRDAQSERDLTAVVTDITLTMAENVKDAPRNRVKTKGEKVKDGTREFMNLLLNADTLLRKLDGFTRGKVYDAIKTPIDEAAGWASEERSKASEKFDALYEAYTRKEQNNMAVKREHKMLGGSFSKWDLISIALNMGNADNVSRLMDKDSGRGFNAAQLEYAKQQLDKRDWDFVQGSWDLINEYWPMIEKREKRLTGVAPKKVEAQEVETPFGTYAGGYYPIKYDSDLSGIVAAEEIADVQQRMMAGRFGKAQTKNGHLQERAQGSGGRVLALGVEIMHSHIGQVIQDLAFSEPVANAWRVLQDPRVRGTFEAKGLLKDHQALEMWLQDTATGQLAAGGVFGRLALRAKNGFTLSKLAFNMSTVLVQMTGVAQSMAVVGTRNMVRGYSGYLSNPQRWTNDVLEASPFMRERETTFHRDINDILGDVTQGPAASRAARFQQGLAQVGFYLMQKVQFYGVDMPTWVGAYEADLKKTGDENHARAEADRMVARAQASGIFADRSAFERGTLSHDTRQNGFVRLFTALGSYMFAKGNIAYEIAGRTGREMDGLNAKTIEAAIKGAYEMGLLFTVEAIAYHAIKGTLPGMDDDDDDDSWGEFLARETALSMMSTIPGLRDLGSSISGFDGGAYASVMSTFSRPFIQVAQGEADLPLFKAMSNAVGVAVGLPSGQLNKTVDAWYRAEQGDDISPIEYLMGANR